MIGKLTRTIVRTFAFALALCATTSAWAATPTPVVVWDGASSEYDFNELTRSGYTINPAVSSITASTIGGDGAYIKIGDGDGIAGVSITNPTAGSFGSGGTTVIIRYSDLIKLSSNRALITLMDGDEFSDSSSDASKKNHAKVGLGQSNGSYGEAVFINGGGVDTYLKGSFAEGMQTLAFVCNSSHMAFYVNGNYRTNRAHSYGSITPTGIMLGGLDVDNSGKFYALKNLKIYAVAIFDRELTAEEIAAYKFPASDSGTPAKWQYANYMLTWQTPDTANTGNMSVNTSIFQYYDNYLNQEKTTTVPGGTAWYWFCYGQQLRNPGVVLRLKNGSYYKTLGGNFDNCTFAGLKVDSDASGYKIEQTDSASKRGTRLGDVSGNAETWFEIGSSFSIMRTGSFYLSGIVNIDIADDAVLSLNDGIENITNGSASHYPAICASVDSSVVSGGALKMHGEGQLKTTKLTATGSKLDYSDLENRANTDPFLDVSTLVIDANTTFAFPANAKLPYQLVSGAISGDLSASDVTYSVGAVKYTGKLTKAADGKSVYYPVSTTISADAAWATLTWNAELPDSGVESLDYIVNVVSDSELNIGGSERTVNKVTFNVAENATLTLTGSALTASDSIYIIGKGAVKVTSGGALKGTIKGNGTVMYSGVLPSSSGITLNNEAWRGTVWIYNYGSINSSGIVGNNLSTGNANSREMANWGNANSYVKFTLVKAYAPNATFACPYTLVLEDGDNPTDYAWRCDNGYSSQGLTFKGLEGDGTFYDQGAVTAAFTFNNLSDFKGKLSIGGGGHRIGFDGTLDIDGGDWSTANLAVSDGCVLNVNADVTIRFGTKALNGTVNIAANKTLTVTDDNDRMDWGQSGTVNVYGTLDMAGARWTMGSSNLIRVYTDGEVNGSAQKTFHFNSGAPQIRASKVSDEETGTATINCPIYLESGDGGTITVDDGMTLVLTANAFAGSDDKRMTKAGEGCLKFQRADSGTTYVPTISAGTIEIADDWTYDFGNLRDFSCVTVASGSSPTLKVRQTTQEVGSAGEIVISNIDSSITSITVIRPDGTETAHTPEDGSITITESDTVVGTVACWHDWEFEGNVNDAVAINPLTLATDWGESSNIYSYENGVDGNQVMKLTQRGGHSSVNYPTEWSAAMRCKMPSAGNKWVIAFGTTSGAIGLASGEMTGDVMLVSSTSTSDWESLADMPVGSPTAAFHVYVFVKTADTVSTYCDGALIDRRPFSGAVGNGFQIGTRLGNAAPLGQATDGQIDYLRLYDYVLSDDQIAKLTSDNPYVPTTPVFTREMAGSPWWYTGDQTWTKSDSTTAQYPAAGSIVEVTATEDASVTMNLPETTVFERLTFKGESSVTLIKNNDCPLSAAELEVKTDVTVPYALAGFTGTRVSVDEGKVLTFDFSSYDYSSVTTTTTIPVTGIVAARGNDSTYDARFGVASGSLPAHIASVMIGYNSTTYSYEVTITPDHEAGATVYYGTGYITAVMDGSSNVGTVYLDAQKQNQTRLFPGDTMVFGESPSSSVYISDTFNGNLEIPSGVTVDLRKGNVSNAVMDGRTITVNGTLTLSQYGTQVHNFGSVTVNGTGTVRFDADATVNQLMGTAGITISEGKTLTLTTVSSWTAFVSGGVSGTGTIKLPAYTGGGEVNLNKFGTEGSTVELTGMNGWITIDDTNIKPAIRLTGNMTISGVSNKTYTFAKITGEGNLTFPNQNSPTYVITEVEGYTGSIVNNHESATLTIKSVKLGSNPRNAMETLVVATTTPSRITIENVYHNNELVNLSGSLSLENKVDGIYIVRAGSIFSVY